MHCPQCSREIPVGQDVCPGCYYWKGNDVENSPPSTKPNILIFMVDSVSAERHSTKVTKYLQPDAIAWNFFVTSPAEFAEVTAKSSGAWQILLTDPEVATRYPEILLSFIDANPGLIAAVEYKASVPPISPLPNALLLESPQDEDEWLAMFYHLINRSKSA